jgi:cytochrome c553
MWSAIRFCAAALLLNVACTCAAQEDLSVRGMAAGCTTCHGPDGRSEGGMPSIAGRNAGELYSILMEFREDRRPATVMHQNAKGYSAQELRRIADYFSLRSR